MKQIFLKIMAVMFTILSVALTAFATYTIPELNYHSNWASVVFQILIAGTAIGAFFFCLHAWELVLKEPVSPWRWPMKVIDWIG